MKTGLFLTIIMSLMLLSSCGEDKKDETCSCEEEKTETYEDVNKDITNPPPPTLRTCPDGSEVMTFSNGKSAAYLFTIDENSPGCCKRETLYSEQLLEYQNKCN